MTLCASAMLGHIAVGQSVARGAAAMEAKRTLIKAQDLQAGVVVLRHAYIDMHPGLYRYNSPAQIDADFDQLAAQLNHDQSLRDAFLAFSVFAAKIKCGHTYPNFFNQLKAVVEELFGGQNRLPFYFEWIDGEMVVTRDFTVSRELPPGRA